MSQPRERGAGTPRPDSWRAIPSPGTATTSCDAALSEPSPRFYASTQYPSTQYPQYSLAQTDTIPEPCWLKRLDTILDFRLENESGGSATSDDTFRVVFVCTGNRARSALAEALLRRYCWSLPVTVRSAGTLDVGALPALREAVSAADQLGVDLTGHRSQALHRVALSSADLVLGFEPSHLTAAVADAHADASRCFLLGELVALLPEEAPVLASVAHARAAVAAASSRRVLDRMDLSALVIGDPLGKPAKVMQRTAVDIDRLVRQVVRGLFGVVAESQPRRRRWR
jgi:protein-tyrosine phosphatase